MRKIVLPLILACLLAGCAPASRPTEPPQTVPAAETLPALRETRPAFPADSSAVYDGCATNGDVTALHDSGCTVSECLLEDLDNGVSLMVGAAPGGEDHFPSVEVRYRPDCTFIRVDASLSTEELTCEAVSAAEVREQTYVVVHGQVQADGSIDAETVYLYRVVP